jgi:hypothetical protein
MGKDVFISYSSADKQVAADICTALESAGNSCWIAPRDILPGVTYADALIQAIDACRVMVIVYSSTANTSPHILREVERAVHNNIPIIPFRLDNSNPSNAMMYYISTPHWLDASAPPLEKHLALLVKTVHEHLENLSGKAARTSVTGQPVPPVSGNETIRSPSQVPSSKINRYTIILLAIAILVITGAVIVVIFPDLHISSSSVPNGTAGTPQPMPQSANTPASGGPVFSSPSSNSSGGPPNSPQSPSPMASSDSASLTTGLPARVTAIGVSPAGPGNVCGTTATQTISKGSRMCVIGIVESVNAQNMIKVFIDNAGDCSTGINPLAQEQFTITGTSGQAFSHVLDVDTTTLPYAKPLCLKAGIFGSKGSGSATVFQIT